MILVPIVPIVRRSLSQRRIIPLRIYPYAGYSESGNKAVLRSSFDVPLNGREND